MSNIKISALPVASTLTGGETIPLVQGGTTKKVTTDQFLTKDAAGNVGVGVTPSAWGGGGKAIEFQAGGMASWGDASVEYWFNSWFNGSAAVYKANGVALQYKQTGSGHAWFTAPVGTAGNPISFTQVMGLNANGVLTVTPTIGQAIVQNSANGAYSTWQVAGTSIGDIGTANQLVSGGSSADFSVCSRSGSLVLGTNSAERARIDASGNLDVGTVTSTTGNFSVQKAAGYEPTVTLNQAGVGAARVYVPAGASALAFGVYNAGSINEVGRFDASGNLLVGATSAVDQAKVLFSYNGGLNQGLIFADSDASATNTAVRFKVAGATVGSITTNSTATSYVTSSDARLKENISNADNGSALIDALQVRKFDWKSDGSHQRYGFVAQELDTVYPEAVSKPADPDEMMGVDYSKLVPLLVQEIQSLRARVAALETI